MNAKSLATFNSPSQSVYLVVPAARLCLRKLYFVLASKRDWDAKMKLTWQPFYDVKSLQRVHEALLRVDDTVR